MTGDHFRNQLVQLNSSDYARRLDRAVDVALTCCACVSAPKGANRGADKSALDATRSRAGMRCVGHCLTVLAHPRTRATVGGAQRLRLHPPHPLAAGTLARRRLVSTLHPGRLCAAGSSRSSKRNPGRRARLPMSLPPCLHPPGTDSCRKAEAITGSWCALGTHWHWKLSWHA